MSGASGRRNVLLWLRRRLSRRAVILMYHAVGDVDVDPWSLFVSPRDFDEQMDVLAADCRVVSLEELGDRLRARDVPRRCVAITFDDGYADNLTAAASSLAPRGLPASFFLVSGAIDAKREFWWDELSRVILGEDELPPTLHVPGPGGVRTFTLPATERRDPRSPNDPWSAAPGTREAVHYEIWSHLAPLSPEERAAALAEIRRQVHAPDAPRTTHRILSLDEARGLAALPGVEIGAHTVNHPSLPHRPADERRREIAESADRIGEIVGRQPTSFAYPYGRRDEETVGIVRDLGFARAVSTVAEAAWIGSSLVELPRFQTRSEGGEAFARRLASHFAT